MPTRGALDTEKMYEVLGLVAAIVKQGEL